MDLDEQILNKLSTKDLEYFAAGKMENMSNAGLDLIANAPQKEVTLNGIPTDTTKPYINYSLPNQPTTLGEKAIGAGEAALSTISGATTGALGGIMNMLTTPSDTVAAQREAEFKRLNPNIPYNPLEQKFIQGAEKFTYAPRTETGQEYTENVGNVIERSGVQGLIGMPIAGKVVPKIQKQDIARIQNAPKDKLLNTAQQVGYIALPSDVGAGKGAKALETLSGKFKSEELASSKNQNVANNLTRKYLGLPESAPLNDDTFSSLRDAFGEPYRVASQLPNGQVGTTSNKSLATGKVSTIPVIKNGAQIVDELKMARDDARAAWKSYNSGTANKPTELRKQAEASEKLATQLENQLDTLARSANQPDLLKALNDARRNIAKVYTVEKATIGENVIDYRKIGKAIDKGAPVTGELALAGKFAKEFPRVNKPVAYEPTAFTLPDVFASGVGLGVDALTGVPFASGLPAARVISRYLMESAPFQQRYVKPKYDPLVSPYLEQPNFYNQIPYASLLSIKDQKGQ